MNQFSILSADLKRVFQEPGCPICRLRTETVRRYVRFLLAENVNDGDARLQIVRGLGFCPEHTWLLYHTEMSRFGDAMGNSILYEDLVERVLAEMDAFQETVPIRAPRCKRGWQHAWAKVWTSLRLSPGSAGTLRPSGECRMCTYARHEEQTAIHGLVQGCADPDFRARYAASDGLCLSHLRQALADAVATDYETTRFLVGKAADRLRALSTDLGEYIRKQAWQYRDEPLTDGERDAPRGAAEFFGGQEDTESSALRSSDSGKP